MYQQKILGQAIVHQD